MASKRGTKFHPVWSHTAGVQPGIVPPGMMPSSMQAGMIPQVMNHPGFMLQGMPMQHPGLMPQLGGDGTPNSDGDEEDERPTKKLKRGRSSSRGRKRRRHDTKEKKQHGKRPKRRRSTSSSRDESGESSGDEDTITDDTLLRRQCRRLGGLAKNYAYSLAGRFDIVRACVAEAGIDLLRANRISLCVQSVVRARHPTHVREPLALSLSLSLSLSEEDRSGDCRPGSCPKAGPEPAAQRPVCGDRSGDRPGGLTQGPVQRPVWVWS